MSWLQNDERPSQKVLGIIMGFMKRCNSPQYLGIISLEVAYSLARTQWMMNTLEEQGDVRSATQEEKLRMGAVDDAVVYVLVRP